MQKSMQHWIDHRFWSWWSCGLYKTGRNSGSWWTLKMEENGKFALENEMKGVYVFGVTDIWNENVWGVFNCMGEKGASVQFKYGISSSSRASHVLFGICPFCPIQWCLLRKVKESCWGWKRRKSEEVKSSWGWFFNGSKKCPPSVAFLQYNKKSIPWKKLGCCYC